MNLFKKIIVITAIISCSADAKRPPKPPKEPKKPLSSEQKQAMIAGAVQAMNGVISLAQDPHDKHNIGTSIAHMLHGIINIIVERIGNRKIDLDDDAVQEYIEELCQELSEQMTEIINEDNIK